jgi:Ca-activated chloride channel family protein
VAISSQIDVDPNAPTRREIVPQELPHGVSAEGVGLRGATMTAMPAPSMAPMGAAQGVGGGGPPLTRSGAVHKTMSLDAPFRAAPAPAKPGKMKDEGFADGRFADDVTESAAPEEAEEPELEKEKKRVEERPRDKGGARKLKARIRLAKDGRIVLEIVADGPLDWTPPAEVLVELADGSRTMATVVTELTTRATRLVPGQSLRLVIELAGTPVRVSFGDLEVEVE